MKARALIAALAAAALVAVPAAAQRARRPAAPAARDWTQTVVRTAEGGYRMGNPAAPVKLVEYGSITCPHCAQFSAEAAAALRARHIRPGRVSWEYRPYMIFPTDLGLFLLLDCLGPRRFFAASEQLYANQRAWIAQVNALPRARFDQIAALPPAAQAAALTRAAGLDLLFRQQGMTPAQVDACLADSARLHRIGAITAQGEALGVTGTPTFFINGRLVGTLSWARLEPMLAGR